ncbi:MAG: DUF92 domain-containing protein [Thermoplasmata archaeon]|nr:DUF92 domain-containing protein [Thermoplasmata archaeon]
MDYYTLLYYPGTLLSIVLSLLLTVVIHREGVLNTGGVISALIIGLAVGVFGGLPWLLLLISFLILGFGATRFHFAWKKKMGVQEGKKGERGWKNAWSTGLLPVSIAVSWHLAPVLYGTGGTWNGGGLAGFLFATSLAVSTSDTFASEIGMLCGQPRMITPPWQHVPVGTNGGVTPLGTLWSLLSALLMGMLAWLLLSPTPTAPPGYVWPLLAGLFGFIGCIFDSLLGALLENRGYLSKHGVNFLSSLGAVALAWAVVSWM